MIDDWYINNLANVEVCVRFHLHVIEWNLEKYLEKCFTQIYRALYRDVMLVP